MANDDAMLGCLIETLALGSIEAACMRQALANQHLQSVEHHVQIFPSSQRQRPRDDYYGMSNGFHGTLNCETV